MTLWIIENLLFALWIFCLGMSLLIVNFFVLCRFIKNMEPSAGQVYMTIFLTVSTIGFTGLIKVLAT
ncbi:hypothetical protein CL653_03740 [bacterium]|nr:hypothetical protein [bacterium]|tara:strand:- start:135 stop:335 length:201 start_codon:yes stop_codon:yes gene_type:complete